MCYADLKIQLLHTAKSKSRSLMEIICRGSNFVTPTPRMVPGPAVPHRATNGSGWTEILTYTGTCWTKILSLLDRTAAPGEIPATFVRIFSFSKRSTGLTCHVSFDAGYRFKYVMKGTSGYM